MRDSFAEDHCPGSEPYPSCPISANVGTVPLKSTEEMATTCCHDIPFSSAIEIASASVGTLPPCAPAASTIVAARVTALAKERPLLKDVTCSSYATSMNIWSIMRSSALIVEAPTSLPKSIAEYFVSSSGHSDGLTLTAKALDNPSLPPSPLKLSNGLRAPKPSRSPPSRYALIRTTQSDHDMVHSVLRASADSGSFQISQSVRNGRNAA